MTPEKKNSVSAVHSELIGAAFYLYMYAEAVDQGRSSAYLESLLDVVSESVKKIPQQIKDLSKVI